MNEQTIVSFPGLGIGDITMDPVLFDVGPLHVRWYGVLILLGLLTSVFFGTRKMHKFNHTIDDVLDILLVSVPCAIVGCRLYFCAFKWDYYGKHPAEIVTGITQGGLAFYGGLIGATIGGLIVMKVKKLNIPAILDLYITQIPIAQAIGRWGNFVNGEAYGGPTTLPWGMTVVTQNGVEAVSVHPTFLYESLWNVVGFILLYIHLDRRKFNGQNALLYLLWYGIGRAMIEGLRADSLWIGEEGQGIRVSQLLSIILALTALVLLIVIPIIKKKRAIANAALVDESILSPIEPVDEPDVPVAEPNVSDTTDGDTPQEPV